MDSSFFVLLFVVASALAPPDAHELRWQNLRHPEQSIVWTREADGGYQMRMNAREMGHFVRDGAQVRTTGIGSAQTIAIAGLLDPAALRRDASRFVLRGAYRATTLHVERSQGETRLVDPAGGLLGAPLRLAAH